MLGRAWESIRRGLDRTRRALADRIGGVLGRGRRVDEDLLAELEEILLEADLGPGPTEEVIEAIRRERLGGEIAGMEDLKQLVVRQLSRRLAVPAPAAAPPAGEPRVVMVVGVNGGGKTTTVGKLAYRWGQEGRRVIVCAADTFRAAASEQLAIWAARAGSELVRHQDGADPSAVAFDALAAARARGVDVVLIDTAGRLHTKVPLMDELSKIHRVAGRQVAGAPHDVLLVVDATTGQNGLQQARAFARAAPVSGLVVTKIDGTAKGGVALAIHRDLGIPIRYLGVGEKADDLVDFEPLAYLEGLFPA
jgi:fused signal recognition particle receptor